MHGLSLLFPFPYWIYVDESDPPQTHTLAFQGVRLRFYPPFRSGPEDMVGGTPFAVGIDDVPFRPGHKPDWDFRILPAVIVVPELSGKAPKPNDPDQDLRLSWLRVDCVAVSGDDDSLRLKALSATRSLMELLRWKTGQWWITRSNAALTRPQYLEFPITDSGRPRKSGPRFSGTSKAHVPSGTEAALTDGLWREALTDLEAGKEIPIHHLLLLEAMHFRASGDLRQSVLEADSACESLKERVFAELWERNNPGRDFDEERRDKVLRNWNLPKHLDETFHNHFGRSYRDEHPEHWETVKNLWLARNNVAHGGANEYGRPPTAVDADISQGFLESARHCIGWLEGQLPS